MKKTCLIICLLSTPALANTVDLHCFANEASIARGVQKGWTKSLAGAEVKIRIDKEIGFIKALEHKKMPDRVDYEPKHCIKKEYSFKYEEKEHFSKVSSSKCEVRLHILQDAGHPVSNSFRQLAAKITTPTYKYFRTQD